MAADRPRTDSRHLPAAMRRDVRLLGEILGQVICESDDQDLLDDVENLRRRVIDARRHDSADGDHHHQADGAGADDHAAALVASWPVSRAEEVARAFTVYFHPLGELGGMRLGSRPARRGLGARRACRPPGYPVGLRLGADAHQPAGLPTGTGRRRQ